MTADLTGFDDLGFDLGITEDLVTGEAVVLDLRPASFITRALALALDLIVTGILVLLVFWLLAATTSVLDQAAGSALGLVVSLGVLIGIPITVETLTRGRSLGKLAAGLRVVRDDGGPIRARHALIRGLLGVLELYWSFGSIALITSLLNRRGKRLGDLLAGTYVIRERSPREQPNVVQMPPHLHPWAAASDLGRLPDRLSLAVRQFLGRAARLAPTSRERLGRALAEQVSRYVAPSPPPGTHPEDFLAAVLAERRDRDYARLRREAEARSTRLHRRSAAGPLSPIGTGLIDEG
ncbi:MAG TPA: RDD family protein [Kineosporiaceae bacterium]|nr:RDD family protein [Kineosporiaceae bacterium]